MAKKPTKKMEEEEDNELPLDNELDTVTNDDLDDFENTTLVSDDLIILDDFDDDEDEDDY